MSELRNLLKMVFILKRRGKIKAKDIAEDLETSERQVRRYKDILDEFFEIESVAGPDGGYKLVQQSFPFKEMLTNDEIMSLKVAIKALDSFNIDENKKILNAIDKINFSILNSENDLLGSEKIIPYSTPKKLTENIVEMHEDIYKAILDKKVIYIKYKGNTGKVSEREVEPLKYLRYKGEYYLVANCLLKNEIRYFKLARIQEYITTNKKFDFKEDIEETLRMSQENGFGVFGGEEYDLKLEIKPPMANTISERIWVENQTIEELEDGSIIFKAKMKGGPELISWILSMGDSARIIEPLRLKENIRQQVENILKSI
ncbi:helix-turn-helix transcriptional regulator [Clostridium paridis]|uniref:WYL domain-containing transcriptional regulator n=1 Tax=Clostridium paridis TaxID=2803863 RepID=A0A937FDL4_9CLOT|nr:WYL domain-containing transcriptional regulator [Clostridium paridis]MBL4931899.1 WYL domain-containing transcriptional regulator [Clostridium paridis]